MFISSYKKWRLLNGSQDKVEINEQLFDAVQAKNYKIIEVLKDHHRSRVLRIRILSQDLVLKIPLEKNRKKWIRFTTWFRHGEAFKNVIGMFKLKLAGIKTTEPVMAAELRSGGMVTNSWLLYNYLDGESCLNHVEHYPQVVEVLKKIHSKGLLHGDPQIRNFILTPDGIYVIDCNPKKKGLLGFNVGYEFAYLRKSTEGIEPYFGDITKQWWYRYAKGYDIYERRIARARRKLKKKLGFKVIE